MPEKKVYKNLKEVSEAFKSGELKGFSLIMDNDDSFLSWTGVDRGGQPFEVEYRGQGGCDMHDALDALGIPWEPC